MLIGGAVAAAPALAGVVQAAPSGGQVVAGQATISGSGNSSGGPTVISQSSDKAIIDWTDFSIGQGGEVDFNNGSGATLNRVTGKNLSSIDGLLKATGSVYLINPNGVIIGKTGQVRVGGDFVASALDVSNANFLSGGDLTFSGPSLASVVNLGKIGALGGDVSLMAVNVRNSGEIDAANGAAGLIAGHDIILRDSSVNDGRFLIVTGGADTAATNDGGIAAAAAELRAEGGNVYALAGNTRGVIRATGVSDKGGKIWLTAGDFGSVAVSGSALTAADGAGNGGAITVTGGHVQVAADAQLDASATNDGGRGGAISVIADKTRGDLSFAGTALARGDLAGGQVESSGASVNFDGARIDTSARNGLSGDWLVDPYDLTVNASAASTISSNLATTNVTLQTTASGTSGPGTANASGNGDIFVNSDISWSSGNSLTLDAYRSVAFNANVTATGSGGAVIKTNDGGSGGDFTFAQGKSLSLTTSGSLSINGASYTLLNSLAGIHGMASSGNYALVGNLTGGSYTNNVYSGTFSGIFTGLGHVIDGLSITSGGGDYGPFYSIGSSGTLRDLGVTNLTVDAGGGSDASGAVAWNQGTIKNVWTSGSIAGSYAGGISAENDNTIRNSFSTANITSYGDTVGGLVGYNYPNAHIIDSYATGTVTNATGFAGGLVGQNMGSIATSFASGLVTGAGMNGGLVALDQGGTVTNSYWDETTTQQSTSGYNTSNQPTTAGGTALTTSQLQSGALPGGFSSSVWTVSSGAYPQLSSFIVPTITYQTIGGTAFASNGSAASGATVTLYSGGSLIGTSATSASDGTYSVSLADGTVTSSTALGGLLTLSGASSVSGLIYTNAPSLTSGNVSGFDLHAGLIDLTTGASGYIALQSLLNTTFGSTNLSSALAAISNPDYKITASGAFTLDSDLTGGGAVLIKSGGDLTIASPVTVSGSKALTFDAHDNLYINASLTASGANAVSLTTSDGGSGDYYFALGDSLSFTGSGASLNINGSAYTLLYAMADLPSMNNSTGKFALAKSLDASSNSYTASVIANFSSNSNHGGIFSGLGNTISNLKITVGGSSNTGLFGFNFGTVRDIGLIGGLVQGQYVGSLVGYNYGGVIKNAYSSATVKSSLGGSAGGLVEVNSGTLTNSFATGSVSGASTSGGLVAANYNSSGVITNSFATGPVSASAQSGGLVGINNGGSIADSFATGYVTGGGGKGGLAGNAIGGAINNSYYDVATTGGGNALGTSQTTAQLQGALPSGFSSSVWATGAGLYPFLKTFYPNGEQAITGALTDNGAASAAGAKIDVYQGGGLLATGFSGANGVYYLSVASGSVTTTSGLGGALTLSGSANASGVVYNDARSLTNGNVSDLNAQAGLVDAATTATSYGGLQTALSNTFGNTALSAISTGIGSPNYKINAAGALNFDQSASFSAGLDVTAGGGITFSQNLTTAGATRFNSAVTLGADVSINSGVGALTFASTIDGAHSLNAKGASLTFGGAVGASSHLTSLTGTATAGGIAVGGQITTTGDIVLAANGGFTNTAGASALNPGGAFTVYTQDAADPTGTMPTNSLGGLSATNYYNDAYDFSAGTFASAVPTGNHFVYAYAASLTPTLSGSTSKTYDAGLTADTSGLSLDPGTLLSAGDSVTLSISGASYSDKNAGTGKTVTADVAFASNPNNYTLSSTTAAAAIGVINKAALTLAAATDTKTYDATTTSTSAVGVTGLQGSDTVTGLSQSFDSKNAGGRTLGINAGYTVNDGNSGGNYTVTTQTASGTITKAALTLAAAADTKTYDATTTSTGSVGVTGLQGSDTVTGLSQSFDSKNAGSRTLGVNSGYTVNDGNSGGNYTVTTQTASGTINKAALTLAAAADAKTYDATTSSTGTVGVTGLQGSDTVTGLSQSYDSKNAGSRTLSVGGGYTVNDGNSGGNYTVTTQTASGTIAKAALTLAAATDTKTYDATTTSTGSVGVTGLQGSDTVTGLSQSFDSKNAGSRTLGVNSGYTVNDGNSGGNYTVTTQTASGTINKAALTLAAAADTKTYDATTSSIGTVGVTGLQGSDTVTGLSQSYDSKNAGSRTLSVGGGYTVNDGNSGGNYTVTTQTASGTINKAALTLAAATDAKTYDATTTSTGSVGVTGLQGSDTVTGLSQSFDSKNAGNRTLGVNAGYTVNDGNSGGNYTVTTQDASGTINKAALTLAAATDTKTYDATTSSTASVGVTGLQGSDTVTGLSQSFDSKNAGSRTLSVSGYSVNDGNSGGNYTVTTQDASGTINKAALTLAAATDTKTYDASTSSTGSVGVTGLQGSDTVTGLSQSFDSKNAGNRTLSVSGYSVNDGNSGGNYTVTTQTASGTINKASLTAGLTGSVEKIYDATTDADLTNANYVLSGVLGSDKVALNDPTHGVYASQNAGSGQKVSVSGIALTGQDAGNYTVNASASANIGVIDQRPITVAADDLGKIVDAADPALMWKLTFGDLVGGDAVTGSLTRDAGENPGHYAITQGSLAASSNYKVTFVGATFTITPTGLQNQPVVNVVQNTPPPPPPTSTDNGSGASSGDSGAGASGSGASGDNGSGQNSGGQNSSGQNTADGQSAGGQGVGGGNENATDPNVHHGSSSSDTCVTGEACSNQPYPGNQQFSSYVSFLSH